LPKPRIKSKFKIAINIFRGILKNINFSSENSNECPRVKYDSFWKKALITVLLFK
jgi:hypothetical protein